MKVRPIPFNNQMVQALLAGRKTQTRRILKNPEEYGCPTGDCPHGTSLECIMAMQRNVKDCPFGKPGYMLWVREAYYLDGNYDDLSPSKVSKASPIWYAADGSCSAENHMSCPGRNRSSRFMPRWASRLTIRIVSVRLELLHSITEADAEAEGATASAIDHTGYIHIRPTYRHGFAAGVWQKIHGPNSWAENPWVWVLEFELITKNIDIILAEEVRFTSAHISVESLLEACRHQYNQAVADAAKTEDRLRNLGNELHAVHETLHRTQQHNTDLQMELMLYKQLADPSISRHINQQLNLGKKT